VDAPRWEGFYFDGQSAERQPVTLTLARGGLQLTRGDGSSIVWPIAELRQTQGGFSNEQLRIERGQGALAEAIIVNQPGLPQAIRRAFPHTRSRVRGGGGTARLLTWGLGGLAAIIVAYVWGAPRAADWAAAKVPPSWEADLGRSVEARMAPSARRCGDSTSLAELRAVLDRLLVAAPTSHYEFHMVVLRDTMVNAFAAPGGFVAVNSGLIAASQTPEEFAGVLAHEVQHVLKRHSTRGILREVPLRLALASIGGSGAMEAAASAAGTLGALRYRRADESEADVEGMRLMRAAQIDVNGMTSFMRTLGGRSQDGPRLVSYLSSHPHTAERVATLERMAAAEAQQAIPLMEPGRWARLRRMCD
jgi:beta-barrel assembly-enhancing protease